LFKRRHQSFKTLEIKEKKIMQQLICQQELELLYLQGKGAWTFFLQIPGTREQKLTGTIDGHSIGVMNLAPLKGKDKILSVNAATRKAIQKTAGERVMVELYLIDYVENVQEQHILGSFRDADVLSKFEALSREQQQEIIREVMEAPSEERQIQLIVKHINLLDR